jgi:hypothetical protein
LVVDAALFGGACVATASKVTPGILVGNAAEYTKDAFVYTGMDGKVLLLTGVSTISNRIV